MLNDMFFITPHEDGVPIFDTWLIKVDTLNKTLEWREHLRVDRIRIRERTKYEKQISERFPECKWLRRFKAVTGITGKEYAKYNYDPTIIWATSKIEARKLFDQMKIDYIKLIQI